MLGGVDVTDKAREHAAEMLRKPQRRPKPKIRAEEIRRQS